MNYHTQIHLLPPELLSLVFTQACLSEERMEIKLSRICRQWRCIALSSSDLWSSFTYCDRLPEANRFSTYLERSGDYPLDLRLNIQFKDRSALTEQLLAKAMEHVSRWRRFSLVVHEDSWPADDPFALLADVRAPYLEWFEVFTLGSWEQGYEHPTDPFRYLFKGGAPLLSCVKLDSNSMEGCMPMSNITELEIESGIVDRIKPFSDFLCLFSLPLIHLSLVGTFLVPPTTEHRRVMAATLNTFRCSDVYVGEYFWQYLHAPQLEVLIIQDNGSGYWSIGNGPSPPLFPSLRILSLINCAIRDFDQFLPLAHATRYITHLYVSHSYNRPNNIDVLHCMAKNSPQTIPWPHLKTLTYMLLEFGDYDLDQAVDVDFSSFLEFFETRSEHLNTRCILELQPAEVNSWKKHYPESWNRLRDGGFYQEMQPRGENAARYVPCPPTRFEAVHGTSEDPFLDFSTTIYA
ncbi:hypothetical protein GALMADRAFT_135449 [Galerina marginata CBS 339.88]|uniref:F-box domain-containing protein n=1 Tax=Galerina marginata (strain CBS 339.88) TaxID=685588 RepID=A0A067TIB0_GALM3|nr:hypothetical protein GALMADRAFT_135449 [Galerina marginata CBS 339.88]